MTLYAVRWGKYNYFGEPCGKWHVADEDDKSGDYYPKTLCGTNIPLCFEGGMGVPETSEALAPVECLKCLKALSGLQLTIGESIGEL